MNKDQRKMTHVQLWAIWRQAEDLADTLDPGRSFTARDETTRAVVKACDTISSQARRAMSMIEVAR